MKLDKQQYTAVHTDSKRALVMAGAGSGKTRVLTERIAHLIENCKVSPFEIVAITFTRKAAGEMKERLENRIHGAHKLTVGTMHSVSLRLVQQFGDQIGLKPKQTTVYSEWESSYLLREAAIDLGIYNGKSWKIPKKDIDRVFADYYERGQLPRDEDPVNALFKTFMARCRENNSLTYGGLLIGLEMLIPSIARFKKWRHILVDEVQDIDPLQWRIINGLVAATGASLFCVGDDSQSIYSFRGAVPEYLIEHQDEFDIYQLQNNYRSLPPIVEAANRLIIHNENRLPLEMVPVRMCESKFVTLERGIDSAGLVNLIRAINDCGEKCTILGRNHILLQKLSTLLTDAGIIHNYVGQKMAITNSEDFRRFHAFLKLIVNYYDNFSFLLIRDFLGLDRRAYNKIRLRAITKSRSHFQAWIYQTVCEWGDFFDCAAEGWSFSETLLNLQDMLKTEEAFYPAIAFIGQWIESNPTGTIDQYLSWLATYDISEEIEAGDNADITLMTIHAAKGLEWENVIIAGCNEGLIPSKQAIAAGNVEDERRLMYVAITRARENLMVTVRPERKEGPKGRIYENPISRFVGESL